MAALYYWSGTEWLPISTGGGGGGGVGPAGPPGADGISVEVFGPQPNEPTPSRKGDHWLQEIARAEVAPLEQRDSVEPVTVALLPDPPQTVFVSYLD
jgi:hypothetical protein